jgi:hypothetical protein
MTDRESIRISGLAAILAEAAGRGPAPVERWSPPYCGDIGLAIRSDGTWEYRGSPIRRGALVKLFARVLWRDLDGRHYLVTPAEKVDVRVADAPFLAVEMEAEGSGRQRTLVFRTNVDDIVRCGPDCPLSFSGEPSGGFKPYVRVRGRLEALVTRSLAYDLAEMVEPDPDTGEPVLWSGGVAFPMRPGK